MAYDLVRLPEMWSLERLEGPGCGRVLSDFIARWGIREDIAHKALELGSCFRIATGRELYIISGYRSPEKQRELRAQGRPAADPALSNHTVYPALAFDVDAFPDPTKEQKLLLGQCGLCIGLRWGGGSRLDDNGIPTDWNHFDLGPRSANL